MILHPVAVASDVDDMAVVHKAVDESRRQQNGPIRLQRQAQSEKFWVVTNGKFTVVTNTNME